MKLRPVVRDGTVEGPHPELGDLAAFARGEIAGLTRLGRFAVLRHLAAGCADCGGRLEGLVPLPRFSRVAGERPAEPSEDDAYDAAMRRAIESALAQVHLLPREKAAAEDLLSRLERESAEPWDPRRHPSVALCELLLEKSFALRHQNPDAMVHLARLAKAAADHLDAAQYGGSIVADAQARAAAELGNALRVVDRLAEAERLLLYAAERLEQGSGDPLLLARVADLLASLYSSQRRFAPAFAMLDRAHWLYLELGDRHLAGRALVSKGMYAGFAGEPETALELLRRGLPLLDPARDPKLAATARQSLIARLADCGHFQEARQLLLESGLRKALADDALSLNKLRWLEGRIAAGLGEIGCAEEAFVEARAGFAFARQGYNAALAGLDLAGVWLREGRTAEILWLVEEMLATFDRLGIAREALGAVLILREACQREALTQDLLDSVRSFLQRLEYDPAVRFTPPAPER